jgi:hypothetical protein
MNDIQKDGQSGESLIAQKTSLYSLAAAHCRQTGHETCIDKVTDCDRHTCVIKHLVLNQRRRLQLWQQPVVLLGWERLKNVISSFLLLASWNKPSCLGLRSCVACLYRP